MGSRRKLVFLALAVAALLPPSVLSSGPYHQPYEEDPAAYAIAHESTEAYDETLEETSLDTDTPTDVDDLSPETRRAFDELRAQPATTHGWQSAELTVCGGRMLLCDEYAERPDFEPTDSIGIDSIATAYVALVENDGERYVVKEVRESKPFHIGPAIHALMTMAAFGIYGAFVYGFARTRGESHPLLSLAFSALGVVLIVWPYLVMHAPLDESPLRVAAGGILLGAMCWVTLVGWDHYRTGGEE